MSFTLKVQKRSSQGAGKGSSSQWPLTLTFQSTPTVLEVKKAIQAKSSKLSPERQRLTTATDKKTPLLDDSKKVDAAEYGIRSGSEVSVKDLGPQISWRTVFLVEYLGPILIHPLWLYGVSPALYGSFQPSKMQTVALGLVVAHYLKREYETMFVHRFSNGTMPLFNLFKNSTHYWILSGVLLAGSIYRPALGAKALRGSIQDDPKFIAGCTLAWALSQLGNAKCHTILRDLRSPGSRERKIPRGFAFELVSCPNYFFETLSWLSFTVLTLSPAALLFSFVSVGQMTIWAIKKHKNYKKEFGKQYPKRKVIFPFVF